ncbi:dihydroorotate dehydrogenase [Endozoicomonas montiporae]|uniref:Dihydroorotate dehydrogenase n=3 Tax=Endozoicomonas montiporae TaxID=1027273 RepID=A0A081MYU8_9GAMM|nr:DASS family sodium-coupled anion symporter [Endozoicomonas montiporae]AMO54833.1 sodium/di- and tricarboxylate cotransporter [Endozoicomonas montiporae CL-33]KEQ11371.1 dihydroorotate dehydrogenase [Endozoicomonas montiporae]
MYRNVKLAVIGVLFLFLFFLPVEMIPISGITVAGQRVMAIFALATLLWVSELVPAYATSLTILGLLCIATSDSAPYMLKEALEPEFMLSYSRIMSSLAAPVVILFMGGFFIAIAATKYKLDINMARVLLQPIGTDYSKVMLGLMGITAIFSMFMSNTATTAMMLTLLTPLLKSMDHNDLGVKGMIMAVPIAANVGGIGTPIGTPPNAIAFRYLTGEYAMGFGDWMLFAIPMAAILIFISWMLLRKVYPTGIDNIHLEIDSEFDQSRDALIVYGTTAATIILWITSSLHGINSYTVALLPVIVFSLCGIISTEDIKQINWDVLWLIAGGIALGYGLERSGLASAVVHTIPFDTMGIVLVLFMLSIVAMIMATFMSNTATANLLMPIAVSIATVLTGLDAFGGLSVVVICVALSASMGMSLPISTPPNALAHATGMVGSKDFIKMGKFVSSIGVLMIFACMVALGSAGYF